MRTPSVRPKRRIERLEYCAIAGIALLAIWLRFRGIGDAPFGRDASHMLELADRLLAGEAILVGIPTSKGMRNPPLSIYLIAVLRLVVETPVRIVAATAALNVLAVIGTWWVARRYWGPRVALAASLLFSVSAWAVIYSRAIWQQDFIPVLSVAALGALLAWTVERRPWALAVAVALAGAVSQLHLTGLAWFGVIAVTGWVLRPPLGKGPIAVGLGACGLLYAPFLLAMSQGMVSGDASRGGPQALFVDFLLTPMRVALGSATHGGLSFEFPTIGAAFSRLLPDALAIGLDLVPWLAAGLVCAGFLALIPRWSELNRSWGWDFLRLRGDPAATTLALWTALPLLAMWLAGLSTHPHYVIILFPAVWILAGLGLEKLGWVPRWGRSAALAATAVWAIAEVGYVLTLQHWIATDPARPGYYGPTLADQQAAMRWIVEDANDAPIALSAVPFPDQAPESVIRPDDNLLWLLEENIERSSGGGGDRNGSATELRYLVLDQGDGALSPEAASALASRGARRFGLLWVCRWP